MIIKNIMLMLILFPAIILIAFLQKVREEYGEEAYKNLCGITIYFIVLLFLYLIVYMGK